MRRLLFVLVGLVLAVSVGHAQQWSCTVTSVTGGNPLQIALSCTPPVVVPPPPPPIPVDCVVSAWSAWTPVGSCTNSLQSETRTRTIVTPAANGGLACGPLTESRSVACAVTPPPPPPTGGANAYFDSLVARPDHWKSYSLRDPKQLQSRVNGGLAYCNSCPLDVVYDAAMDAAKATIGTNTNSLRNQIRPPMGTQDGHTYFVTWDAYYTNSYLPSVTKLINHKAYQFAAAGSTQVFEVRTRFDGGNLQNGGSGPLPGFSPSTDVSAIDARVYFGGPGTTKIQPMLPQAGTYILKPNRWVRFFVLIEQTTAADFFSLWVADSSSIAQIQNRGATTIPAGGLFDFWVELNTSTDAVAPGRGPMVNYVRNWVALRDVANVAPLLVKP